MHTLDNTVGCLTLLQIEWRIIASSSESAGVLRKIALRQPIPWLLLPQLQPQLQLHNSKPISPSLTHGRRHRRPPQRWAGQLLLCVKARQALLTLLTSATPPSQSRPKKCKHGLLGRPLCCAAALACSGTRVHHST